jgi:hypothetical protein
MVMAASAACNLKVMDCPVRGGQIRPNAGDNQAPLGRTPIEKLQRLRRQGVRLVTRSPDQEKVMPRASVLVALSVMAVVSLAACQTDGAPAPGGHHPPPGPPPPTVGKMCGGIAAIPCGAGQYCRIDAPMYPDKSGVCTVRPQVCPMIYKPVCGMNGKTYGNACQAASDGASVDHAGPCAPAEVR